MRFKPKADSKFFLNGSSGWKFFNKEVFFINFTDEGREARGDQEAEESGRKAGIGPPQLSPPGDLDPRNDWVTSMRDSAVVHSLFQHLCEARICKEDEVPQQEDPLLVYTLRVR